MNIGKNDTALVLTDPQNDVLSESGVAWPFVGAGVRGNRTVENIERLLRAAKDSGYGVFVSPHYCYPRG
jgi:nicotinamidase-related amidase